VNLDRLLNFSPFLPKVGLYKMLIDLKSLEKLEKARETLTIFEISICDWCG